MIKYAKLILAVCCLLGISLCLFIYSHADNGEQLPIQTLRIMVDNRQRDELFTQLHRFADKHAFEFQISYYDADKENFLVTMLRDDIKILIVGVSINPNSARISFYNRDQEHPASKETVGELINDLHSFILNFPIIATAEGK